MSALGANPSATRGAPVTALILAGGLGRRMSTDGHGVDKGLQTFEGRPMIAHVIERLAPQVAGVRINANQNLDRYRAFGWPVVSDRIDGFVGPLAGMHAGLSDAPTAWVITAPCDTPFLPTDLVARMAGALFPDGRFAGEASADLAVARTAMQVHPVILLLPTRLHTSLAAFLARGGRKIDAWYAGLRVVEVVFDDEAAFQNINTLDELRSTEAAVRATGRT